MANGHLLTFLRFVHVPANLVQLVHVYLPAGEVQETRLQGLGELLHRDGVLEELMDLQRRYERIPVIGLGQGRRLPADLGGDCLREVAAEVLHLPGSRLGQDGRHGLTVGQEHRHRVIEGVARERRQLQLSRL